jgi:hypothetical protein
VWGFTAGLLARILAEAGLEQPWDTKVYRPLPELRVAATEPSEPSDVGLA